MKINSIGFVQNSNDVFALDKKRRRRRAVDFENEISFGCKFAQNPLKNSDLFTSEASFTAHHATYENKQAAKDRLSVISKLDNINKKGKNFYTHAKDVMKQGKKNNYLDIVCKGLNGNEAMVTFGHVAAETDEPASIIELDMDTKEITKYEFGIDGKKGRYNVISTTPEGNETTYLVEKDKVLKETFVPALKYRKAHQITEIKYTGKNAAYSETTDANGYLVKASYVVKNDKKNLSYYKTANAKYNYNSAAGEYEKCAHRG